MSAAPLQRIANAHEIAVQLAAIIAKSGPCFAADCKCMHAACCMTLAARCFNIDISKLPYDWPCITGLSEAMLGPGSWQLGETGSKYMKTIKNSSTHLSSLINDILDAAAASKGKLAIKMEKVCRPTIDAQACGSACEA